MLILQLKQEAVPFVDSLGNTYPDMVAGIDYRIDPIDKTMYVRLRYFKDVEALTTKKSPVMVNEFFWNETGEPALKQDGSVIDWAQFMVEVPRNEWKDVIKYIGRTPFNDLVAGIDVTINGFDFKANQVGAAWKQIMLFLPLNQAFATQSGCKFLDEVFEYAVI